MKLLKNLSLLFAIILLSSCESQSEKYQGKWICESNSKLTIEIKLISKNTYSISFNGRSPENVTLNENGVLNGGGFLYPINNEGKLQLGKHITGCTTYNLKK